MFIKRDVSLRVFNSFEKNWISLFLLFCVGLIYPLSMNGNDCTNITLNGDLKMTSVYALGEINDDTEFKDEKFSVKHSKKHKLTYYLNISDFAQSFIEIPTSNVSGESSTISSKYLAGRAALYDKQNKKVGTCSASFLCIQNADGIYTDISNFLSVDNGLIVTWFTPTTLINLELDSIIHSMVTKCIVVASTKVGFNPFFGKTFDLVVSSDDQKIYFKFSKR